jgi:hypothetical protein
MTPAQSSQLLQDASKLARTAYASIELMAGAGTKDLHYSVVDPLQRWFDSTGLTNTTLFRAQLVANYEITAVGRLFFDRIRDRSSSLDAALNKIEWPLQRVTVPSNAFGILPHYAIVAHEIGHALWQKVSWDFSQFAPQQATLLQNVTNMLGGTTPSIDLRLFLQKVQRSWLAEIASDAFGHLMAGPAFFFALCGFLEAHGGGVGISETHPPNDLRRDLIFERLQSPAGASFADAFHKGTGEPLMKEINSSLIDPLPPQAALVADLSIQLQPSPGVTSSEKATIMAELIPYLRVIADQVYKQAEDYLEATDPDVIYDQAKFANDINVHLEPLLYAIPPIETQVAGGVRVPCEFASILNVGWVTLLTKLDNLKVRKTGPDQQLVHKAEALHSLLLKAVELSEARRTWEAA